MTVFQNHRVAAVGTEACCHEGLRGRFLAPVCGAEAGAFVESSEYEDLRERHLEEVRLRGKENRKIQYAVLCSAAVKGGLEPDQLHEVIWWGTDGFWRYRLLGAVALIRVSAARRGIPVEQVAAQLADRRGISLA